MRTASTGQQQSNPVDWRWRFHVQWLPFGIQGRCLCDTMQTYSLFKERAIRAFVTLLQRRTERLFQDVDVLATAHLFEPPGPNGNADLAQVGLLEQ